MNILEAFDEMCGWQVPPEIRSATPEDVRRGLLAMKSSPINNTPSEPEETPELCEERIRYIRGLRAILHGRTPE